jgi:hypothetical protein
MRKLMSMFGIMVIMIGLLGGMHYMNHKECLGRRKISQGNCMKAGISILCYSMWNSTDYWLIGVAHTYCRPYIGSVYALGCGCYSNLL